MNFPNKKYQVIYADPPWHFQNWNNASAQTNPEQHYSTMSMKDIENLPVGDIADTNCVLFMWCTDPLLHKQIPIVKKWGFEYKTVGFTWVKTNKDRIRDDIVNLCGDLPRIELFARQKTQGWDVWGNEV